MTGLPFTPPCPPLPPTPRQHELLCIMAELIADGAPAPSLRDLGAEIELTPSNIHKLLVGLRERGWVDWTSGTHRSLRLLHRPALPALEEVEFFLAADLDERSAAVAALIIDGATRRTGRRAGGAAAC